MLKTTTKLVVVDDEEDLAEFVADVADGVGFDATFLSDPHDFAEHYSIDIGVFVFDLFMPGIDGIELLRFLAESRSNASVIFMSGKDKSVLKAAQELAKSLEINVLGSIQKPFRAADLEEILEGYSPPAADSLVSPKHEAPTIDELREAIEKKQFHLVYQPQVSLKDYTFSGVEALIRWNHPVKGSISPDVFIPMAEEYNLIQEITWFVAHEALMQAGEWRKQGYDLRLSINMSPKNFQDLDLPEKLATLAQFAGADVDKIMIEVTETALMVDVSRYIDVLTRLRMKGFGLSIDDFGTGYSSLQQLIRVSFNELKIDQTFIRDIETEQECQVITEISSMLAHKLNMYVVAEGIENENIWNHLRALGCEEGQGYWIAKPMRPEELGGWYKDWVIRQGL
ncbi:EAL domain-containing protein [Curvivirga sp.]|uniref:GGDEF/EAL domain-containing response regulator n=1 Tax=Curvivirga sp. TaxID=2856848 RepID=UPI003B5C865C